MTRRPVEYDLSDYHDDGTLRVSVSIIAMVLFLSRHVLLIFMGGVSTFKGAEVSGVEGLYSHPMLLLASIPALLVLIAMLRRVATGGTLPRAIWRAGRWLLCIAAVLDVALTLFLADFRANRISVQHVAVMIGDAFVLLYLLRSQRVRDTFADFPAASMQGSRS
jgi:hypothetical protein